MKTILFCRHLAMSFILLTSTRFGRLFVRGMATATSCQEYDLVVIGGGSAGLTAAKLGAYFDKSTVIIEESRLGGDCTWTGCVPSKTLIASAKVAHALRTSEKYGIKSVKTQNVVDWKAIKDRIRAKIDHIYEEDDSPDAMTKLGVETLLGHKAVFTSSNTLDLIGSNISVKAKEGIVIATGASPMNIESSIPGLQDVDYITYENIFELPEFPSKLTIVGGGPIGCELAQAFARLGSQVTQVARRLSPNEEDEVSEALEKVFVEEGIKRVEGRVVGVETLSSSKFMLKYALEDGSTDAVECEGALLVAAGRRPNSKGMGLEELGVELKQNGGIATDKNLKTTVKGVYAAGDCTGDQQFTHYAGYQGAIAARNILLPLSDTGVMTTENIPSATFTSPEISSVGMSEKLAVETYGEAQIGVAMQRLDSVDRAICDDTDKNGFIKIVYWKKKKNRILGATVMAPSAGELISEISVAIRGKMGMNDLATVMHAYPVYSFVIQTMAADIYYSETKKQKPILDFLKRLGL